jgi:hypothetical protein
MLAAEVDVNEIADKFLQTSHNKAQKKMVFLHQTAWLPNYGCR